MNDLKWQILGVTIVFGTIGGWAMLCRYSTTGALFVVIFATVILLLIMLGIVGLFIGDMLKDIWMWLRNRQRD